MFNNKGTDQSWYNEKTEKDTAINNVSEKYFVMWKMLTIKRYMEKDKNNMQRMNLVLP